MKGCCSPSRKAAVSFFVLVSTLASFATTQIYRSVGPGETSDLNTDSRTVTISGNTATFSGAMPDKVGVGDGLEYHDGEAYRVAFIHGRTSSTVYTVQSASGGTPQAVSSGTAVSVYRAYTSLSNAEAGTENTAFNDGIEDFDDGSGERNIVTADETWNFACYGDGEDTDAVVFDGWTCSGVNYIKIYTPVSSSEVGTSQRHDGKWNTSAYRLAVTDNTALKLNGNNEPDNMIIEGLQIETKGTTGGYYGIYLEKSDSARVGYNIIRNTNTGSTMRGFYGRFAAPWHFFNNIIYDFNTGIYLNYTDNNKDCRIYSNTVYGCDIGIEVPSGAANVWRSGKMSNNLCVNNTTDYDANYINWTETSGNLNNASSDNTGDDFSNMSNSQLTIDTSGLFVDRGNEDFHIKTAASIRDDGADLSPEGIFSDDIDGESRSTWDIGADEYTPPAIGDLTDPVVTHNTLEISELCTTTIYFITEQAVPVDGDVQVTFNSSFDISGAAYVSGNSGASVSTSGQVLTINLGTALAAAETVSIVIAGIENPDSTGSGGDYPVETQNSSDETLDQGTAPSNTFWATITQIYRSVGPGNTSDLNADGYNMGINGSIATFAGPMPDSMGVGDVLEYQVDSEYKVAFVHSRLSATGFTVKSVSGASAAACDTGTSVSVYRAYTSLANAEAGTENTGIHADVRDFDTWSGGKDIASAYEVWNIACYKDAVDETGVTIDGWTTTADRYLRIYTPTSTGEVGESQRHKGKAGTGYVLDPNTVTDGIKILDIRVHIEGLEITDWSENSSNDGKDGISVQAQGARIHSCLIHDDGHGTDNNSDADGIAVENVSGVAIWTWNNIIYNIARSGIGINAGTDGSVLHVHNTTIYNTCVQDDSPANFGGIVLLGDSNCTMDAKNVIAMNPNSGDDFIDNGATGNDWDASQNNMTSDGTAVGTSALTNKTASEQLRSVTSGSEDLHLLSTSDGIGAGMDLATLFQLDIDGHTRESGSWDMGADQYLLLPGIPVYRSMGYNSTADLNTGGYNMGIQGDIATFAGSLPNNVGVGDVLQYQVSSTYYVAFIHGRTSSKVYTVASAEGGRAMACDTGTAVSVYRAYTTISNAESGSENTAINASVRNFDSWSGGKDISGDGANQVWNIACYADAALTSTTTMTIGSGWTTDSLNYLNLYTPYLPTEVGEGQRHVGVWDDSKFRIELTAGGTYRRAIRFSEHYTQRRKLCARIEGFQIHTNNNNYEPVTGIYVDDDHAEGSDIRISHNIVKGTRSGTGQMSGIVVYDYADHGKYRVWNNLVYGYDTDGKGIWVHSETTYVYNNTVAACDDGIYLYDDVSTIVAKNNISTGNTDDWYIRDASGGNQIVVNNGSDEDISSRDSLWKDLSPNTPASGDWDSIFVDWANRDYRLRGNDTLAKNQGLDLSYDSALAFSTDNQQDSRESAQWDIGADEHIRKGLYGEYHKGMELLRTAHGRLDTTVDFDWAAAAPHESVDVDTFSVAWTGYVIAPYTGTYKFYVESDGGARLWVNDELIVDNWEIHATATDSGTVNLVAGQTYLELDYRDSLENALCKLSWAYDNTPKEVISKFDLRPGIGRPPIYTADVGDVDKMGSHYSNPITNTWIMTGAGDGIQEYDDELRFTYWNTSGDFTAKVYVDTIISTDDNAWAGIMVRTDLNDSAAMGAILATKGYGNAFKYRSGYDEQAQDDSTHSASTFSPVFLKLERAGGILKGYASEDGYTWDLLDEETDIGLPDRIYVGIGLSNNTDGTLAEAKLMDWSLASTPDVFARTENPLADATLSYKNDLILSSETDTLLVVQNNDAVDDSLQYALLKFNMAWLQEQEGKILSRADLALFVDSVVVDPDSENVELLIFEIAKEDTEFASITWETSNGTDDWFHQAVDDSEGVGTEDLAHNSVWNYNRDYGWSSRRRLASIYVDTSHRDVSVSITSTRFSTAMSKAVRSAMSDTTLYLMLALKGKGKVFVRSTTSDLESIRPKLNLTFSTARRMFQWSGLRDTAAFALGDSVLTYHGSPSLWQGRYGRVKQFTQNADSATVAANDNIVNSRGRIEFWYQTTGTAAETHQFIKRDVVDEKLILSGNTADSSLTFELGGDLNGSYTWKYYLQDGKQHHVALAWDADQQQNGVASLLVDGTYLSPTSVWSARPPVNGWQEADMTLASGIGGYMENFQIFSSPNSADTAIVTEPLACPEVTGNLPEIPLAWNGKVDCIVLSPDSGLFYDELQKYASRNLSLGLKSLVVPLPFITENYVGADVPERIRNFLIYAYKTWEPSYLVLGANMDLIPARELEFPNKNNASVATDKYYANLQGTWNADGDQFFGELNDAVDMTSELIVGRFPASTFSEVRTMVEKSTAYLRMPPFNQLDLDSANTMLFTGMQMFSTIGEKTDAAYYADQIAETFEDGQFTENVDMRSFFPNDSGFSIDSLYVDSLYAIGDSSKVFINSLDTIEERYKDITSPSAAYWVHFGHGGADGMNLFGDPGKTDVYYSLLTKEIPEWPGLNSLKTMVHARFVACLTGNPSRNSLGVRMLFHPYGGAVTYVGTAETSYPSIDAALLAGEARLLADSSVVGAAEAFSDATDTYLATNGGSENARWVAFGRNFLGDPILPFRNVVFTDSIVPGTPPDPGPGAQEVTFSFNLEPDQTEHAGITVALQSKEDPSLYASGITNSHGEVTFSINTGLSDTLIATATHPNAKPVRQFVPVGQATGAKLVVANTSLLADSADTAVNFLMPNDSIFVSIPLVNKGDEKSDPTDASLTINTTGSGIDLLGVRTTVTYDTIYVDSTGVSTETFAFLVNRAPPGVTNVTGYFILDEDTTFVPLAVIGPKVFVTQLTVDDSTESGGNGNGIPDSAEHVHIGLSLANLFPVKAKAIKCTLVAISNMTLIDSLASIGTLSEAQQDTFYNDVFEFTVDSYTPSTDGLIQGALKIGGENFETQVYPLDFNPILDAVEIESARPTVNGGVRLQWTPVKEGLNGLNSDFVGYQVFRNDTLLNPVPLFSTNYFVDEGNFGAKTELEYFVQAVDSSYAYPRSLTDTVTLKSPYRLKANFPMFTDLSLFGPPVVGDYDHDGRAEIYFHAEVGRTQPNPAHGYTIHGEEVGIQGVNDGLLPGGVVPDSGWMAGSFALADFDADGVDEVIYSGGGYVTAYKPGSQTVHWQELVGGEEYGAEHRPVLLQAYGGEAPQVAVHTLANSPGPRLPANTHITIFDSAGTQRDSIMLRDGSYSPGLAAAVISAAPKADLIFMHQQGNFVAGSSGLDTLQSKIFHYNLSEGHILEDEENIEQAFVSAVHGFKGWVNSPVSIGNLDDDSNLEFAFTKGFLASTGTDSFVVYELTEAGFQPNLDWDNRLIQQKPGVALLHGTAPAIGDINGDGTNDVAVSRDDTVYAFDVKNDSLLFAQRISDIGSDRLPWYGDPSSPILADLDDDGCADVLVTSVADGVVHAFPGASGVDHSQEIHGFPVAMGGPSGSTPTIADVDADGLLDLVCASEDMNLYAWALDVPDTAYVPWPSSGGNAWNTRSMNHGMEYRPGYVYLDFTRDLRQPDTLIADPLFERTGGSWICQGTNDVSAASNFRTVGSDNWNNYVISGKLKMSDNHWSAIHAYRQSASDHYQIEFDQDSVKVSGGSLTGDTAMGWTFVEDQWFKFKIQLRDSAHAGTSTIIRVKVWTGDTEPDYQLDLLDFQDLQLLKGSIGFVHHGADAQDTTFWDSIRVIRDAPGTDDGAYIAYETFPDSGYISPFHPQNWREDFSKQYLDSIAEGVTRDTSGFTRIGTPEKGFGLVAAPDISYPANCRLIPRSGQIFDSYTFDGKIWKDVNDSQDSVGVGVIFHASGPDSYYVLRCGGAGSGSILDSFHITSVGAKATFDDDTTCQIQFPHDPGNYHWLEYKITVKTYYTSEGAPDHVHIKAVVALAKFESAPYAIDSIIVTDAEPAHSGGHVGISVDCSQIDPGALAELPPVAWDEVFWRRKR